MPQPRVALVPLVLAALSTFACASEPQDGDPDADEATSLTTNGLRGVWGSSAEDVWVVGAAGTVLHFDGEAWTPFDSGTDRDLQAVHGTGPDDVWAVGADTIVRWDGAVWTEQLAGVELFEELLGVWCERPGKVWMSGVATDVNQGLMRLFEADGDTAEDGQPMDLWVFALASGSTSLWDVWGSGPGDVWSGGTRSGGGGYVVHGGEEAFDLVGYDGGPPRAIWGTAADDVWIAPYEGAMHHWDGTAWAAAPGADVQKLIGAGGSARDDAWVVGLDGAVFHWDGAGWEPSEVDTVSNLSSVWAADRDDAWIVGAEGTLLRWDGSVWRSVSRPAG
jgi:hypothetical protein